MKTRTALLALAAGAGAIIAACSSPEDTGPAVSPSGSTTATATTSSTTSAPATSTVGPTGTTTTATSTGGTGVSSSGGTGTSGGTGSSGPVASECTETSYSVNDVGNDNAMFSGVRNMFVYGDGTTSACLDDATTPGTVCMEGNAVDAGSDYATWGVGIGMQLSETTMDGTPIAPWNATELGIVAVKFTVTNLTKSRPLRVQLAQVNDPAITENANNYQENGFLSGGSSPKAAVEGENTIPFENFKLPSWNAEKIATGLGTPDAAETLEGTVVDGTKLHQLQFQVSNDDGDDPEAYKFCLSGVQWLDAAGNPVTVVIPPPVDDSSGDTGSGSSDSSSGSSGSDTGSDSSSGSSDSASSSSGSGSSSGSSDSSGGALDYTADILPIFTAKCGGPMSCHFSANPPMGLDLDDEAEATAAKADIADRIQRADGAEGKMPATGMLTEGELATLVAWTEQ